MSSALIDTNVNLFRWPFRALPCDETPRLIETLRKNNIAGAWAGSFEGLLHRDVGGVNLRLARECEERGDGLLLPFGTVNPTLPDWEDDLRRCHEELGMPGIRLHPNYHGYKLDDPRFRRLLELAADRGLIVQLAVKMEDERTQHPLVQVEEVDTSPLVELLKKLPPLQLVLLNALRSIRPDQTETLATEHGVSFDIAMLEGVGGVRRLLETVPVGRVLFGTHAPLFYMESAVLKLRESPLSGVQRMAISEGNARRLLATSTRQ